MKSWKQNSRKFLTPPGRVNHMRIQWYDMEHRQVKKNGTEDWEESQVFSLTHHEPKVFNNVKFLGVMVTKRGVTADNCVERTGSAIQRTSLLWSSRIHEGTIPLTAMLTICQLFVQPTAPHTIHLKSESCELQEIWKKLVKESIKMELGIYWERKPRLRERAELDTLNEEMALKMTPTKNGWGTNRNPTAKLISNSGSHYADGHKGNTGMKRTLKPGQQKQMENTKGEGKSKIITSRQQTY